MLYSILKWKCSFLNYIICSFCSYDIEIIFKRKYTGVLAICINMSRGSYYLTLENSFEAQFADILVIVCFIFCNTLHFNWWILWDNKCTFYFGIISISIMFFIVCHLYSFLKILLLKVYQEIFELLYVGVMSSGIAYTLQVFGQRYVKPSTAAITFSLEGVFDR